MREALNENPLVQMAVLGVVAVIFAFIMFTSVLKKEDTAEQPPQTVAPAATGAEAGVAPAAAADPAAAIDPATGAPATGTVAPPASAAPATPDTGSADGLLPSKGLPKDLLVAYAKGDAIALVVVDPKAKGNGKLVRAAESSGRGDVKVFKVDVNDIAKYSRITQGVSVSRTPALIVITPRKLSEGVPMASVSYGFRSPASVDQAIDDAFYEGGNVPAYP